MIPKKVMLAGNFGVGKTSLFNRFIHNTFNESYFTTIGVKVDSKIVNTPKGNLKLMIWDIAGEVNQDKVPKTYWLGAKGVIYVFDLTRPTTWEGIKEDLAFIESTLPGVSIRIVANKKDLVEALRISEAQNRFSVDYVTSAKTGEQVDELFENLAEEIYDK